MISAIKNAVVNIKTAAIGLLGIALAVVTALFYKQKANHEQEKRKSAEHVRDAEHNANQAMIESIGYEYGIRDSYDQTNHIERTDLD